MIVSDEKQVKGVKTKNLPDIYAIWITVLFLVGYGLVMIYSASAFRYVSNPLYGNDSMYLLKRQLVFVLVGLLLCFILQYFDYAILYRTAKIIYFVGLASILLLLSPLGASAKGATRWLNIAGVQFQVAEVVKISVIILLSYIVQRYFKRWSTGKLVTIMWILGGGVSILLLVISNDLSSSVVVAGITFGMTFIYTNSVKLHLTVMISGISAVIVYVVHLWNNMPSIEELNELSFRIGRMAAWLDPERYADSLGYQPLQALYAIGSGGFFGKGLGESLQKINAIPEAQNDMIFSIICEELGILGAIMLLYLFLYLAWQLFRTSFYAKNLFGSALAAGVLLHIGLQTFINIGVNVNLLPNTGIGLPFISYGGTAVFCQLIEMAIVMSVARIEIGRGYVIRIKRIFGRKKKNGNKKKHYR